MRTHWKCVIPTKAKRAGETKEPQEIAWQCHRLEFEASSDLCLCFADVAKFINRLDVDHIVRFPPR